MSRLSVSFLVDEMRRVPGGCGPNIAYGLALLGERPAPPRDRRAATPPSTGTGSAREGIDVAGPAARERRLHRVLLRLDRPGPEPARVLLHGSDGARAAALARHARPAEIAPSSSISPNDPPAMAALRRGLPASAGSRSSTTRASRSRASRARRWREGFRGAAILIVNDYEFGILTHKTGMDARATIERAVPVLIVTHGPDGSAIHARSDERTGSSSTFRRRRSKERPSTRRASGDAYRAGLLRGLRIGAPWPVAGRIGSVAAVFCLEHQGPQPPRFTAGGLPGPVRPQFRGDARARRGSSR